MWDEYINAAKQGRLQDLQQKIAEVKTRKPIVLNSFAAAAKQAQAVLDAQEQLSRKQAADSWFAKQALIDASQMAPPAGGGAPPPMDPAAMGGAPPMDPAMMGMPPGGAPPMDPAMMGAPPMDPAAMGAMPPGMPPGGAPPMAGMPMDPTGGMGGAGGVDPATGKPQKMKVEDIIMKECGRIKEMLNALFQHLDIPIPPSVVDSQEMSRAILEQQARQAEKQQVDDNTIPGNPMVNQIPELSQQKIGETLLLNQDNLAAILRAIAPK